MNAIGLLNVNTYNTISLSGKSRAQMAQQIAPITQNNPAADKVTISEQGKMLSKQAVPEELLRMAMAPGWYQDFLPVSSKVGTPESYQVGHTARMDAYKETYKNELTQYGKIFHEAFETTKKEFGINTQNDMYEKVIKNPEYSETIRQAIDQKIAANPKAIELMNALGIKKK